MRKILVVLVVAAVLVLALSIPAMAAPAPSHTYPGSVVTWAQDLKGPVPVDFGDGFVLNHLGKDVIPLNKGFAIEFGYATYGQFVRDLAQQDK